MPREQDYDLAVIATSQSMLKDHPAMMPVAHQRIGERGGVVNR